MRGIILLICITLASSLQIPNRTKRELGGSAENENDFPVDGVDQILQHFHQMELAPFVPTDKATKDALAAFAHSVINLVNGDRGDEAKRLFEGLKRPETLSDIVRTGYDSNLKNTVKLVDFLRNLDQKSDQMRGFSALYDEMKRRKDMRNLAIIEIAYWLRHHVEDADVELGTDEFAERFLYYDTEVHSIINEAMQLLGERIRSGDYDEVLLLSRTYPGAFTAVIPRLIEATYNKDVSNVHAIMGLARTNDLSATHKERVLDALLTQMQRNNHLGTPQFEELRSMINSLNLNALKKRIENLPQRRNLSITHY